MNPNYNQTITVYNRIKGADAEDGKDIWKRTVLEIKGAGNSFTLNPGDIVVKDVCMEEITGKMPNTASELLARQKPEAFQITAFSDNTSHLRGKHYRVGG